jgi:hypothetical protein
MASSIAARLTGFFARPAKRPFNEATWVSSATTLKPSLVGTKSTLLPACKPSAALTASGKVICPLDVRVAAGIQAPYVR